MQNILVVGSINIDLISQVKRFPLPGETLKCDEFSISCGGKGANQAVAASRLGAKVSLIGAVGDDEFGSVLLAKLRDEHINIKAVKKVLGTPSGTANIITARGENSILFSEGANKYLTPDDVLKHEKLFEEADIILSQLEIPLETVSTVADLAEKYQKPFILNPAPAYRLPKDLLEKVTLLTPNEHEFVVSLDLNDSDVFGLFEFVTEGAVLTRGEEGAYFFNPKTRKVELQPAFEVDVVDTIGAGDVFSAATAVFFNYGIDKAVKLACAAAAVSVSKQGAQQGMPTEEELVAFVEERGLL